MSELIGDQARALIGYVGAPRTNETPISLDELRRFVQAAMETNPVHWSAAAASSSKFEFVVAVPLYPAHALRRPLGSPDPLDEVAQDPMADGAHSSEGWRGLPEPELGLSRIVNGGTEAEFYQLARLGDTITAQSEYLEIGGRSGRSGPLVVIRIRTRYSNQDGDLLTVITVTRIAR